MFYQLIIIKEWFCIRQIKKIATIFTYLNISHELITSKICQLYLKSYQYDPQNMHLDVEYLKKMPNEILDIFLCMPSIQTKKLRGRRLPWFDAKLMKFWKLETSPLNSLNTPFFSLYRTSVECLCVLRHNPARFGLFKTFYGLGIRVQMLRQNLDSVYMMRLCLFEHCTGGRSNA